MIKFFLGVIFSFSLLYSQNILHEDFIVSIGSKIYSPLSDKPFTGKVIKFFPVEQIEYEYSVTDGQKNGQFISFFKGGNILEKGSYKMGLKEGMWIKYDQYYNRKRELTHFKSMEYLFKNGKPIQVITYSINGDVRKKEEF